RDCWSSLSLRWGTPSPPSLPKMLVPISATAVTGYSNYGIALVQAAMDESDAGTSEIRLYELPVIEDDMAMEDDTPKAG
ncbi:MAG: hypothetical protein WCE73_10580, partial [Candidatus Angelobacter sp.]